MTHRECSQCGQALRVPTDREIICGECAVANRCDKVNDRLRALLERAWWLNEDKAPKRTPTWIEREKALLADIRKELGK